MVRLHANYPAPAACGRGPSFDLATLRDRVTSNGGKLAYGALALRRCGSATHWQRYWRTYAPLARIATTLGVVNGHATGFFCARYGGSPAEQFVSISWVVGPHAFAFWLALATFVVIQAPWFRLVRLRPLALFIISLVVLIGMWFDTFKVIVGSLSRGYLPSS